MHRRYNRWWGRFNQPDPSDGSYDLTDPQSLNRYSYVQNDPVNYVDPTGLNRSVTCSYGIVGTRPDTELADRNVYIWGWMCVTETWDTGRGGIPGIDDLGTGGEPPQKHKPYVDTNVLGECIQELFGVVLNSFTESRPGRVGSFTGTGPSYYKNANGAGNNATFTVTNDAGSYTQREIERRFEITSGKTLRPGESITGFTNPYNPLDNYTASDLRSVMETLKTQVHELGHSLDAITAIGYRHRGKEAGQKLENCVAKRRGFKVS